LFYIRYAQDRHIYYLIITANLFTQRRLTKVNLNHR